MAEISFWEVSAGITVTAFSQRGKVCSKFRICNFYVPLVWKSYSVSSESCCRYAVKHIYSMFNSESQIFRSSHSHKVSWFIIWEERGCVSYDLFDEFSTFSDTYSSDGDSVSSKLAKVLCGFSSQVKVAPSLHDRKKYSSWAFVFWLEVVKGSFCPAMCHSDMFLDGFFVGSGWRADIKYHHDIWTEFTLSIYDIFWGKHMLTSIIWGAEFYTLFRELYSDFMSMFFIVKFLVC